MRAVARLDRPLLPLLRGAADALHDPLNLTSGDADAAGLFEVAFRLKVGLLGRRPPGR